MRKRASTQYPRRTQKQWRVANDGSCDWDGRYRLKLLPNYPPLGISGEPALYPARAGTQAVLTLTFSAPIEPGTYRTAWQAYNPQGAAFGDEVYMEIIVQ
ncbi:MAG: NBR1-Ig-like domain-containing protein [Chloroflexi bacterium]|nr:NBR1-Ig-like domain-containing protein [Chloroflexota bacterium]